MSDERAPDPDEEAAQPDEATSPHRRRMRPERRELETVKPLELYFDLVFVLGFTQCTALMVARPTWEGIAHGMLVLAMLWWAWVGYAWLTSVIDPEEGAVRLVMFAAMAGLLIVALSVPGAFGDLGTTFAIAYAVVRVAQLGLFALASRDDAHMRRSVITLAATSLASSAILIAASFLDSDARTAVWVIALTVDFGGPMFLGIAGWTLMPAHFAERHNLVIILALGESIVALGVASQGHLGAGEIAAAVLGVGIASALWWMYFDVVALVTAQRLTRAAAGVERNALARDSYSYLHYPMVAGIVLGALGLEAVLAHVDEPLDAERAFALLGGVAIYLLAHVLLRLRNAHTLNRQRLVFAILLLALVPGATRVDGLVIVAALNVPLWAVIAYETWRYGDSRYRLRHGIDLAAPR